ncbi:MAG: V-type ATP synthase subunit D [Myxococcota bacterium]
MAKIKLSKHELARQRNNLKLYQKLLPSLDLKRRQLTVELKRARKELEDTRAAVDTLETKIGEELPMLAFTAIDVDGLVRMKDFALGEENVVGVRLPVLERIDCVVADYSMLGKPAWVDVLVDRLRDAAEQRTRLQVSEERVRLLEQAVRRTTQRVNLFERILIPRSREAIKRIMIYLGDLERSSVANSKLTKAKIKKQQEALHGGRS